MKKLLLFLMVIVAGITASAQDVIVKKDGTTVLCKIVQANNSEVIYLKWSDLDGPQYIMDSSLVANINYQDGRQDKLNEHTSNNYAPGIQQTGESQYNDNALLAIDRGRTNSKYIPRNAKILTIIGWTVGPALVLAGGSLILSGALHGGFDKWHEGGPQQSYAGIALVGAGIATTTGCLVRAHQIKKEANMIAFFPLIQKEFNLHDNSSLSAGIDIIQNCHFNKNDYGLGLGLKFNF